MSWLPCLNSPTSADSGWPGILLIQLCRRLHRVAITVSLRYWHSEWNINRKLPRLLALPCTSASLLFLSPLCPQADQSALPALNACLSEHLLIQEHCGEVTSAALSPICFAVTHVWATPLPQPPPPPFFFCACVCIQTRAQTIEGCFCFYKWFEYQ